MNATEPPRPSLAVRAGRLFVIFMGPSLGGLGEKFITQIKDADACPVFAGAKELMNLFEQLSARFMIFVQNQNFGPQPCSFHSGRQARRTGSHHDNLYPLHCAASVLPLP